MEGGFSKALLMRKLDGTEVVAKLPFKIAGPAHYTTASEVAVLKYGTTLGTSPLKNLELIPLRTSPPTHQCACTQGPSLELGSAKPRRSRVHHHGEGTWDTAC